MTKRSPSVQARKVLEALSDAYETPGEIALRAGLPTRSRVDAAARISEALERRGLAERGGTKAVPKWRRSLVS